MEANELHNIILTKFENLEKGQEALERHMDKRFEQVDKRFEQVDKRLDKIDRELVETRSMINSGLRENRSEIQNSRRFAFTLFCFAMTFSVISLTGLVGKLFGLF